MSDPLTETGPPYTALMGTIYVFNVIVGTGALTIPKAFGKAGWLVSLITMTVLAFVSYMTATFVIEAMANANAVRRKKRAQAIQQVQESIQDADPVTDSMEKSSVESSNEEYDETQPLLLGTGTSGQSSTQAGPGGVIDLSDAALFDIKERMELGQMTRMFFNKLGKIFFYCSITVYLYGDLAIYAAAVPKSLRDVICIPENISLNSTNLDDTPCWHSESLTRLTVYRLCLLGFILLLGPFFFFNVQETAFLQIFTTVLRWLAFLWMIILAILYLAHGEGKGNPKMADMKGIPNLFGVVIYSFMCHHSLPAIITPVKQKRHLFKWISMDYGIIFVFYCIIAFTAVYVFPTVCLQDLYTLNFQPQNTCDGMKPITSLKVVQYYLALFPVFTLSANFPIFGITLRNNLKTLFYKEGRTFRWAVDRIVFPLVALIPPIIVAMFTDNIQFLVGITGSFAGSGIQYFIPASLVMLSRRQVRDLLGPDYRNQHQSPFTHKVWPILVFVWAVICICFVLSNHLMSWFHLGH